MTNHEKSQVRIWSYPEPRRQDSLGVATTIAADCGDYQTATEYSFLFELALRLYWGNE